MGASTTETRPDAAKMRHVVAVAPFERETMKTQNNRPIYTTIFDDPRQWNDQQIREYYDQSPNFMLADFARMTGSTVVELKRILMQPAP